MNFILWRVLYSIGIYVTVQNPVCTVTPPNGHEFFIHTYFFPHSANYVTIGSLAEHSVLCRVLVFLTLIQNNFIERNWNGYESKR